MRMNSGRLNFILWQIQSNILTGAYIIMFSGRVRLHIRLTGIKAQEMQKRSTISWRSIIAVLVLQDLNEIY